MSDLDSPQEAETVEVSRFDLKVAVAALGEQHGDPSDSLPCPSCAAFARLRKIAWPGEAVDD